MASVDFLAAVTKRLQAFPARDGGSVDPDRSDLAASLAAAVQGAVERIVGRPFGRQTFTERYNGNGRPLLWLRQTPVILLSSVSIDGATLTVEAEPSSPVFPAPPIVIDSSLEALARTDGGTFTCGRANIIVTYDAGMELDTYPAAFEAAEQWAAHSFLQLQRRGVTHRTIGEITYDFSAAIPDDIKALLATAKKRFLPC